MLKRCRRWVRRHKVRAALLAAAAVGNALLWGLEAAVERGGHSLDPTDAMNYDFFALRNDSPSVLYVHLCDDPACARLQSHSEWITVRPGAAAEEQVYWGSDESATYEVASDARGAGARCLLLDARTKASTTVDAPLSAAGPCGG